jgi:predicted phosphodiesterase
MSSKMILLSDLHLVMDNPIARVDDIVETEFKKLTQIFEYARANKITTILQAGDFTDGPRSWRLLPKLITFLKTYEEINVYVVFGQHDKYMYSEDISSTNLGVLLLSGKGIHRLSSLGDKIDIDDTSSCFVVGVDHGKDVPEKVDFSAGVLRVLVIHKMIVDSPLWVGQENYYAAKKFLSDNSDYDLILCGDAHKRFIILEKGESGNRIIINTGPLLRLEASKDMLKHKPGFAVYDVQNRDMDWIPLNIAPAEDVLSRAHIENDERVNEMMEKFIASISCQNTLSVSFEDNLKAFIDENKIDPKVTDVIGLIMEEKV